MLDPTEYRTEGPDPYIDPASGILRNIPKLTRQADLERFERTVFMGVFGDAQALIHAAPAFNLDLWREVHRLCFSDIYDWAGHLRTVRIEKGATMFAFPECIEGQAARLFYDVNRAGDARTLTDLFGELNIIHPFREGNGRTQRMIFAGAFHRIGLDFRYELLQAPPLINALIAAYHGQPAPLRDLFDGILAPL